MPKKIYYYVYRITNLLDNKHYYGKRGCNIPPKYDLGVKYFSSSYDKKFIKLQKENPSIFKYKVIKIFSCNNKASLFEIKLHKYFNVGINKNFYNRCIQTDTKFDRTGIKMSVEDKKTRGKPVINLDTKEIYYSIKEASRVTGIESRTIINVCKEKGNQFTAGSYHWAYVVEGKKEDYYNNLLVKVKERELANSKMLSSRLKGAGNPSAKLTDIYCYYTNILIAENVNMTEWARENKVQAAHLSSTISGKRNHSGGFYAKRKE